MSEAWAKQQMEKFQFSFDQADKDKSGSLSFQEVFDVLRANGFAGSHEEAHFIFGHLDKDGSKSVSKEEFRAAIKSLPKMSIREFVLRKAFLQLDKNGNGFLSKSEIMDATKNHGEIELSAEKISDLLIYISKEDDDEQVRYDEFLYVLGIEETATVLRRIFKALDADGSGFLSRDEVLQAVKTDFELKLSAEKISDLVIYLVKDDDKKISYDEFMDVWLKQKEQKKK